jgi:ribonuclease PH
MRKSNRRNDQLRDIKIHLDYIRHAQGSVLIETGDTKVICTASVENKVPPFLLGSNKGWITAEYGMIPMSTQTRSQREASKGKPSGRTQEIQRLIGRALRGISDLTRLGARTLWLDCDVIQADGGTRTASITGSFVALALAIERLREGKEIQEPPLLDFVAATSVGIVDGEMALDLDYREDSTASVDMNVVMTGKGKFVEVQGTAEGHPYSKTQLTKMLALAQQGIEELIEIQKQSLTKKLDISRIIQDES